MTQYEFQQTYRIIRPIGKGGGGEVFLAEHLRLQKLVVIKKMLQPSNRNHINRHEADLLKSLRHPSLPGIIDYIQLGYDVYTIMDYIEGNSLDEVIKSGRELTLTQIQQIGADLCSALEVLHEQHPPIIHCDIKPGNVMITPQGRAVLIDFNISLGGPEAGLVGESSGFASPELNYVCSQIKANARPSMELIGPASDIFELGATLYTAMTHKVYNPQAPEWDWIAWRYVPELADLLAKALRIQPEDRIQSASQLKKSLENLQYASQKMIRFRKAYRMKTILCCAGLSLCCLMAGFSVHQIRSEGNNSYYQTIDEMIALRESGSFDACEDLFEKASGQKPDRLDAYFQRALCLYEKGDYQGCASFIERTILTNPKLLDGQANAENTLYLLADSWYRQKDYAKSITYYQQLFERKNLQPVFYRDYAIVLGANGQSQQALQLLDDAEKRGLDSLSLQYAKAELAYAAGNREQAISSMQSLMGSIQEPEVLYHAGLSLSEWLDEAGRPKDGAEVLEEMLEKLPENYHPNLLEQQVQLYVKAAAKNPQQAQTLRANASASLQRIIAQRWDSFSTHDLLARILLQNGDLDQCDQELNAMEAKYGSQDYRIEKRRAFFEIEKQNRYPNEQRSYIQFAQHYDNATRLYDTSLQDPEMDLLNRTYQEVKNGEWL